MEQGKEVIMLIVYFIRSSEEPPQDVREFLASCDILNLGDCTYYAAVADFDPASGRDTLEELTGSQDAARWIRNSAAGHLIL